MATAKPKKTDKVRNLLDKLPTNTVQSESPPIIQEAKPRPKLGRKMHRQEGIKYVRISPAIPEDLKIEMDVAIKTRFRGTHPTIDTFIELAVRELLNKIETA
jgi:hypothetical protein